VVRITAGDTVTWTNNDYFTHTIKVEGQDDHEVGRGDSFSIGFPKRGTYDYERTLHRHDMRGTVIVS
jgi:plastocyanin